MMIYWSNVFLVVLTVIEPSTKSKIAMIPCRNHNVSARVSHTTYTRHYCIRPDDYCEHRIDETYMLLENGGDMSPDFPQIDFPILGKERSETALLQEMTSLIPILLQLLER